MGITLICSGCKKIDIVRNTIIEVSFSQTQGDSIAIVYGRFIDLSEQPIQNYGHCWSYTPGTTISDERSDFGELTDRILPKVFESSIDYEFGELMYVRGYAITPSETVYGEEISFSATIGPTIVTSTTFEISDTSAKSGGNVTKDGGELVTSRGVCWSTSSNPTISDQYTENGSGTGSFTSELTGLIPEIPYYIRAYATNSVGTSYGQEESFTTLASSPSNTGTINDSRDGQVYDIVKIGQQWWMAENLNTGIRIDSDIEQTDNSIIEKYCYDNLDYNGETFGGLYKWDEMMQYSPSDNGTIGTTQGVCPSGWHIPTDNEWKELEMYLGMIQTEVDTTDSRGTDEGGKLKDTILWISPNTGATNSSGFTALPGGYRNETGGFNILGSYAYFWSSTESGSSDAWGRWLSHSSSGVGRDGYNYESYGFSVRCIKD